MTRIEKETTLAMITTIHVILQQLIKRDLDDPEITEAISRIKANSKADNRVKNSLINLLCYTPEYSTPADYAEVSGWGKENLVPEDHEKMPLFTEGFLYLMLGKDQARSLLYRIKSLCRALGYDMDDLQREGLKEDTDDQT